MITVEALSAPANPKEFAKASIINNVELLKEEPIANPPKKKSIPKVANNQAKQENCFDYVPKYSQKWNVDANLMTRIIQAESGGNSLAKNKNSTASGCAQFIKATWEVTLKQMGKPYITPFDANTNVEALAWKIAHGGLRAWDASKSKWSK